MNIYTFIDRDCNLLAEVKAKNLGEAIVNAQKEFPDVKEWTSRIDDYSVSKIEE